MIGRAYVSVNIGALCIMAAAVLMGQAGGLALSMAALTLHEAAHTLAAMAAGKSVAEIELTPVGLCAYLPGKRPTVQDELFIAAAGPLFSLFAGMGCFYLYHSGFAAADIVLDFAQINICIAAVNMLPALPLDGGRMLESLLRRRLGSKSVRRICAAVGVLCGAAVTAAGAYAALNAYAAPTAAVFGMFITISAIKRSRERDVYPAERLNALRIRLNNGLGTAVRYVALDQSVAARRALRETRSGSVTVFTVMDSRMHPLGNISEAELYRAMAAMGAEAALGNILNEITSAKD